MSTMQSTVRRIDAEQAYDGWEPAGPVLVDGGSVEDVTIAQADLPTVDAVAQADLTPATDVRDGMRTATEMRMGIASDELPLIAHLVVFHLREGESRNRRTKFPAIVMDVDAESRRLTLWVIVDDGDTWMQEHVPARVGPEQGWVPVAQPEGPNELSLTVARLGDRIGELETMIAGMESAIEAFGGRLGQVEDHPALEVPPLTDDAQRSAVNADYGKAMEAPQWTPEEIAQMGSARPAVVVNRAEAPAKRKPGRPAKSKG